MPSVLVNLVITPPPSLMSCLWMERVSADLHTEIDGLVRNLTDGLHIDNSEDSDGDGIRNNVVEKDVSVKLLSKSATFPSRSAQLSVLVDVYSDESVMPACTRSVSLPTPRKSAMKGSREKQGIPPVKMNVKWAADVYDPIPTIVSHTVKSGKQKKQHKNDYKKKSGKKGQRDKLVKGSSSSSGRKKHRKSSGSSSKCYEPLTGCDRSSLNPFDVLDSFEDSTCGTSFLKESAKQLHYAVAQAL
ncbi:hypothetical protein ACFE04_019997 [Oxalis oulophora]